MQIALSGIIVSFLVYFFASFAYAAPVFVEPVADGTIIHAYEGQLLGYAILAQDPADNLRMYYKFDETQGGIACDLSGHGYNGTLVDELGGELPLWQPNSGKFGGCLQFKDESSTTGMVDYVDLPTAVMSGLTDFTFEAWIKPTDSWCTIFESYGDSFIIGLGIYNDGATQYIYTNDWGYAWSTTINLYDGGWHHIRYTRNVYANDPDLVENDEVYAVYIDSILAGSDTFSGWAEPVPFGGWLALGRTSQGSSGGFDSAFDGYMDDVKIWGSFTQKNLTYGASNIPSGSTWSAANHILTWTPGDVASPGGYYDYPNVQFTATDPTTSAVDTKTVTIRVHDPVNNPPNFSAPSVITPINEGDTEIIELGATDPNGDDIYYTYTIDPAIPGGNIPGISGNTFTWNTDYDDAIKRQSTQYTITFTAHDGRGGDTTATPVFVTVNDTPTQPVFVEPNPSQTTTIDVNEGDNLRYAVLAKDPVDDNLRLYYKLDETSGTTVTDSSGMGNNGTISGTYGWSSGGYSLGCVYLASDSAVDCTYIGAPDAAMNGLTDFTFETRIKTTDDAAYLMRETNSYGSTTEFSLSYTQESPSVCRIYIKEQNQTGQSFTTAVNLDDNNWHHIRYVREYNTTTTDHKVYIDDMTTPKGALIGITSGGPLVVTNMELMGYYYETGAPDTCYFNGQVDEIKIWGSRSQRGLTYPVPPSIPSGSTFDTANHILMWNNIPSNIASGGGYADYDVTFGAYPTGRPDLTASRIAKIRVHDVAMIGSIIINSNAVYTATRNVTLALSASDPTGITHMKFSEDNAIYGTEEGYATSKSYTIQSSGDGEKTVYVKFKNGNGQWPLAYSDSITLDTTPPAIPTINPVTSPTNSTTQTITGTKSTDTATIVVTCATANVGTVSYPTGTSWSCALTAMAENTNSISVKAKDAASNESSPAAASILVDTTPPTGTISINNGSAQTSTTTITLYLTASDSESGMGPGAEMKLSNDGLTYGSPASYATSYYPWELLPGTGTKTVWVKFKDAAGNWTTAEIKDDIILDITPYETIPWAGAYLQCAASGGESSHNFYIPQDSNYAIWLRVGNLSDYSSDAITINIDGGEDINIYNDSGYPTLSDFRWINFRDGNPENRVIMYLPQGNMVLTIKEGQSSLAKVDSIIITDDLRYFPDNKPPEITTWTTVAANGLDSTSNMGSELKVYKDTLY
ncbi:MAG: LamG-like jellyroll fold domain-containing protein, partial [Candidatus Omnitrophota bacterium]|nr:LamG-like jellyroll fold domain-containing protein [Candidatus Omnitrophota bacterium]